MKTNKIEKNIAYNKTSTKVDDREGVKDGILARVEKKVEDQFEDEYIDRQSLKIELRNGTVLDTSTIDFVTHELQNHEKRFPQEYYQEIFRLNKHRGKDWAIPENGIIVHKPHLVGKWTKEIIYSRFGKDMLPVLENYNPYIAIGVRRHKHYQFLDDDGIKILDQYIQDAIDVMKLSNSWYNFRIKLYQIHKVPYQLDIFYEQKKG